VQSPIVGIVVGARVGVGGTFGEGEVNFIVCNADCRLKLFRTRNPTEIKHSCPSGLRSSTQVRVYSYTWVQIPQNAIFSKPSANYSEPTGTLVL
jgi:hypothetical protein